jgi:hypothetical protein
MKLVYVSHAVRTSEFLRHRNIHEHNVKLLVGVGLQRFLPIFGFSEANLAFLQEDGEQSPVYSVVIYD